MRKGWNETAISDVAEVLSGFAFKSEQFSEKEGIPLIRIRDLQKRNSTEVGYTGKYEERYVVNAGDFLIGMDGEFRCYEWLGHEALLNQRVCRIQSFNNSKVVPRFIYFLVNQYLEKIEESTSFTTVKHISVKQVKDIRFPMPPLTEQRRIVDLVSSVDAYIDALQQQADSARVSRNAVLYELLSAGGTNWTETTLGEVSDFTRGPFGGSLKKEIFVKSGYAVFEQQHAIYGDFSSFRYFVIAEKFEEMSRFRVSAGDLIMSCSGTIGKVSIVPPAAPQGIINQALLKISPKSEIMGEFLLFWTQSEIFKLIIGENSGGAVQQNVASVKILKSIAIALPPLAEQKRIIEVVSSMDEVIQSTEQAVDDAKALRSGLLSDLLSGNHEIPASYDSLLGAA